MLALAGTLACRAWTGFDRKPPHTVPTSAHAVPAPAKPAPARPAPTAAAPRPAAAPPTSLGGDEENLPDGVFHVVQSGQTLWRIARGYGVSVDAIVTANNIKDPASIEVGRALFVPGARATVEIAPYPAPLPAPPVARIEPPNGVPAWIWPISGELLSRFGVQRRTHVHRGVDIRGQRGDNVVAARSGRVVFAGRGGGGYGLTVVIDHGDAQQSLYAHNDSLLVKVGDDVKQGAPIAHCGRSGNATTEHVHFEIRKNNTPQDPLPLLGEVLTAKR